MTPGSVTWILTATLLRRAGASAGIIAIIGTVIALFEYWSEQSKIVDDVEISILRNFLSLFSASPGACGYDSCAIALGGSNFSGCLDDYRRSEH